MKENISRERFIRLGALLGVTSASASVLAACGGDSGVSANNPGGNPGGNAGGNAGGGDSGNGGSEGDGGEARAGGSAIARESEVAPGSAVKFKDSGEEAVLVHLDDGDFVAYSAVCTHQRCTVAYKNGQLACPCHGSVFDPANGGEVVSPPAETPLREIPVEVRDGQVFRA